MKKSTIVAVFISPIEKVWEVVTNNENYTWRSDLSKIVVSEDKKSFIEYDKSGFETEFTITKKEPARCYQFSIKNKNMNGNWTGIFLKDGNGTKIEFTEEIEVKNPIMKLMLGSYLKKQQQTYVADLRKALGE